MYTKAKRMGFSDVTIAKLWNTTEKGSMIACKEQGIVPVYKKVDTCAGRI